MKNKEFAGIIFLFTLLRLLAVSFMGLMPQDAYYTYYAENLSWSYFDHPPMVAYMIRVFITLFGKSAFSLHFGDFLLTSATLYLFYLFLRRFLEGEMLRKAFLLVQTAPFITILMINTTPDVPLMFFWTLALLLIFEAVKTKRWYFWLLAGLASGLAFDSKYTALFLPAGLFCFLFFSKEHRQLLLSWKFVLFAAAFVSACFPVIYWNIQHDFISIKYQSAERASGMNGIMIKPKWIFGYLGTQLAIALPVFFVTLFISLFALAKQAWKREKIESGSLFAASFSLPMLCCFTAIAFISWVKMNWIMPVFISGGLLAVPYFRSASLLRRQTVFSVLLHILLIVEIIWMPIPINSDDTWWGWDKLAEEVRELKTTHQDVIVFSDDLYKTSAALNFYLPDHVYAGNLIGKFAYQFGLDDADLSSLEGRNALFISSEKRVRGNENIQESLEEYFEVVTPLDNIILRDNKNKVRRRFAVFKCDNYAKGLRKH